MLKNCRFPGQEHVAGNTKIPSVIYYDRHGKMMAAGAEADTSGVQAQAEDEGWIKAELFVHLISRPYPALTNLFRSSTASNCVFVPEQCNST